MRPQTLFAAFFCIGSLCGNVDAQSPEPIDAEHVREIAATMQLVQWLRMTCATLTPAQAENFERRYNESSIPQYIEVFGLPADEIAALRESNPLTSSPQAPSIETRRRCDGDYVDLIREFDERYGHLVDDVRAFYPTLVRQAEAAAKRRRAQWDTPSGEQNNKLFSTVTQAINRSFDTGDWTIFARLFRAGTFDCWMVDGQNRHFDVLARPPIPLDARHEIREMPDNYVHGLVFDPSSVQPTHLLKIWHDVSYPSRCSDRTTHRRPRFHLMLAKQESGYQLVHGCPASPFAETAGRQPIRAPVSKSGVEAGFERVTAEDREAIVRSKREDRYERNSKRLLMNQYGLSRDEAVLVTDEVCRTDR